MIVLHAAIAITAVIGLIIWLRVDPVISLVLGSLYLGIAGGVGLNGTVTAIAEGFGEIMVEVGLLIGFGVLLGALLYAMGALQKFVELLLRVLGPRRLPYTLAAALTTLFPSIYVDVQLVLASPLARSSAPHVGRNGLGMMGGALSAGILVGYVFVVPGLGTVSIAGLLDIPLGTMLIYGLLVGPLTAVLTVLVYGMLIKRGFWNPATDEADADELRAEEALAAGGMSALVAVLLAWLVAALLHLAIGSISVAAIAASGILAPVLGGLDVQPVIIGLAIGAGALFALQVNSNFFWMFQTLLGVTTRGALKALTFVTALASVLALPMILLLSVVV